MTNSITILIPGGFKPAHAGHLNLIKKYSKHPQVKEVQILVGPAIRDGIDQEKATRILERLTADIDKTKVIPVRWPSPVLTAYKMMEKADPGYYALATSKKGQDYKTVESFTRKHSKGGRFYRGEEGVFVVGLPMELEPLLFKGRDDEHEGKPISSSVLRDDIVNDDLQNFSAGYPYVSPEDINFIWDEIASDVMMSEGQFGTGPITHASFSNYDRSQPGYYYKSTFPIAESNSEELLEGGAAGHLMSPWESLNLSFSEIEDIIEKALSGNLENVTEKLDGQNIMVTYRDGNAYLARTQKQMANMGENSIKWDGVYNSFADRVPESVKNAFQEALNDIQLIFSKSEDDIEKILGGGKKWVNMELINPETENIVPYGEFQLRIHNIREVDERGKEVNTTWEGGDLDKIIDSVERVQEDEELERIHLIAQTNRAIFKNIFNMEEERDKLLSELEYLMDENSLDEKNTLGDYIASKLKDIIEKKIKDNSLANSLLHRWAYADKSENLREIIKKTNNEEIKLWIRETDKDIGEITGEILEPIISIFSRLGIVVLNNLSGIASTDPSLVSQKMKKKALESIKSIQKYVDRKDIRDKEDFDKKVRYLETQLRRIEQAGGLEGIAPLEGIVFKYGDNLFKLTGIYLPILKIINFFQFGKDK